MRLARGFGREALQRKRDNQKASFVPFPPLSERERETSDSLSEWLMRETVAA